MTDTLADFFGAWANADAAAQKDTITDAMAADFVYSDPRSDGRLTTIDTLASYVAQFTANAGGMMAGVIKTDTHNGYIRAIVGFGANGAWMQKGTYFATHDDAGKISLLSGFIGTGDV
jgi:hypothetical protein